MQVGSTMRVRARLRALEYSRRPTGSDEEEGMFGSDDGQPHTCLAPDPSAWSEPRQGVGAEATAACSAGPTGRAGKGCTGRCPQLSSSPAAPCWCASAWVPACARMCVYANQLKTAVTRTSAQRRGEGHRRRGGGGHA